MSNPTFSANLERLHGVGSSLPHWVPPAIRCRSFPEIKWPLQCVYQRAPATSVMALCELCFVNSLLEAGLFASHTPFKASRMTKLLPNLALLCFFLAIFTSLHPFPNHLCLRVIDRMFSSMFRWIGNRETISWQLQKPGTFFSSYLLCDNWMEFMV